MADVYAVVAQLSGEAHDEVLAIWELLDRRFGLKAAQEALYPHLTFFVGEGGDLPTLRACVAAAAAMLRPVEATIDGLGVFTGFSPVLFQRIVHDAALTALYDQVVYAASCARTALWPHYAPGVWVPHVTLALRDMPPQIIPAVFAALHGRTARRRTTLSDLRLVRVRRPLADSEYLGVFPLGVPRV